MNHFLVPTERVELSSDPYEGPVLTVEPRRQLIYIHTHTSNYILTDFNHFFNENELLTFVVRDLRQTYLEEYRL